ncbi:MAG: hypothetical protein KDD45_16980 [Bdellovibrionales bacterium]|nr:hypothetical protein [Bdellovibrionales bacterium]
MERKMGKVLALLEALEDLGALAGQCLIMTLSLVIWEKEWEGSQVLAVAHRQEVEECQACQNL